MTRYLNALEPEALIEKFLSHPPENFEACLSKSGAPAFQTKFDLLTTLDPPLRRRILRLPLYRHWCKALRPRTCFVGTTVSEYALFPREFSPAKFVAELKAEFAEEFAFLIVKDVPQDSPLLDAASNAIARDTLAACEAAGFVRLEGQALAYVKMDFDSIDTYLARLSAGRRRDIRRKLRRRHMLDIQSMATGDSRFDNPQVLEEYYALYLLVYEQSELHFDRLTPDFFRAVLQDAASDGVVFEYRHAGQLIGFNLCFCKDGYLIDKYIGLRYPEARRFNLYFISWMHNIEYALAQRLTHYVAGWTDPEIKAYLGAQFTFTYHAVHIRNPILRAALKRLSRWFESDRQWFESQKDASPDHP